MIDQELKDKITETLDTCALHLMRMEFAKSKINAFIPLSRENYYTLNDEMISFLDQYIFRFSKLQDLIGNRLFPLTLEILAEPTEGKSFIDILNRLEKLEILDSAANWIQIRKIRNDIAHEYPASLVERIEGINYLFDHIGKLRMVVERCKSTIQSHS